MLGALLVAAAFAGCAGGDGEGPAYASYEEAKSAPGSTHEPIGTDSPIRLKLLAPSASDISPPQEADVVFLLYNSETDEPVTNAQFTPQDNYSENCAPHHSFCAEMPGMGHGTSPEASPQHEDHGVYRGMTNFGMNGDWLININPEIDGEVVEFEIEMSL